MLPFKTVNFRSNHIEGSRLTHEQTRWIFETQTVGEMTPDVPVDDVVETANHFRAVDYVITSADVLVCGLRRFGHEKLANALSTRCGFMV